MGHRTTVSALRTAGARILREGLVEVFLAGAVFVLSRLERPADAVLPLVLDLVVAGGAALSGRWLLGGAIAAGVGATAWLFVPWERPTLGLVAVLVPLFTAVTRGRRRLALGLTFWYLAVMLVAVSGWTAIGPAGVLFNAGFLVVLFAVAWATGLLINRLRTRFDQAADEYQKRLVEQRLDLARDLHDTLAQTVTGMVVTTEGIKLQLGKDCPPEVAEDLETILRLGRQSITDLRGMMGVLRSSDPDGGLSAWRVESVQRVLDRQSTTLERHGFTVSAVVEGDPDGLPPSVRECVGKLIVEATSNMAKHASPGGHCSITVDIAEDGVDAVFSNPYDGAPPGPPAQGLGLVGANERIEALGGQLSVHSADGQWVLRASLPVAGHDEVAHS